MLQRPPPDIQMINRGCPTLKRPPRIVPRRAAREDLLKVFFQDDGETIVKHRREMVFYFLFGTLDLCVQSYKALYDRNLRL